MFLLAFGVHWSFCQQNWMFSSETFNSLQKLWCQISSIWSQLLPIHINSFWLSFISYVRIFLSHSTIIDVCFCLPIIDGNTALELSSHTNPVLHIPDTLSTTKINFFHFLLFIHFFFSFYLFWRREKMKEYSVQK